MKHGLQAHKRVSESTLKERFPVQVMLHLYPRGYIGQGLGPYVWEMLDPVVADRKRSYRDLDDRFDIERGVAQCGGVYSEPI
jgi:hypothetical protein